MTHQHLILAVEDERNLRELMEEILTDAGFEVLTAPNALAAFEIIQSAIHIDAIVTDIDMPGAADGRELARFIRNTRPQIHIVLLAGAPLDPADPLLKHVHYLQKPLGLMQLASTLSIILGEARVIDVDRTFIEANPLSNISFRPAPIELAATYT
jgi:two-component system, response regulator PdtaR